MKDGRGRERRGGVREEEQRGEEGMSIDRRGCQLIGGC